MTIHRASPQAPQHQSKRPPPVPELTVDAAAPDAVTRAAMHVYDILQNDTRIR